MYTPISFGAKYIDTVKIKDNTHLIPIKRDMNLVEFDINNPKDITTMEDVADIWEEKNNGRRMFAHDYYRDAFSYPINTPGNVKNAHFYAITTQKDNFEKIDPETVVCISHYDETTNKFDSLEQLQAEPNSTHDKKSKQRYKNSGSAMVRFLQNNFKKSFEVDGLGAQEFYTKMGFVHPNNNVHISRMVWYCG